MIKADRRLRLCTVLLGLNIAFIWGNSMLPGEISGALSDLLKNALAWLLGTGQEYPPVGGGLLRKLAHFTEFACLGVLLHWLFRMLREKTWEHLVFPALAGIAVAAVDETIQCFVPLRGPALKDVGIDTLGVVAGIVIISLIFYFKKQFGGKQK